MSNVQSELNASPAPRYIVGIDLGTTNCAMAKVDTGSLPWRVEAVPIDQWVDWQTFDQRLTLPSFHYQWTIEEAGEIKTLPSHPLMTSTHVVGVYARDRGVQGSQRQISSAKSWLCHGGVDRTAPILPWHGEEDVEKISPVVASARYLEHLARVWDRNHPDHRLADCDVVLTLPASFDEVARELTIEAARLAGLPRIVLIEEPQAAFYAWLSKHAADWSQLIRPGESILVCDIGGGTTDFTLIRVRAQEAGACDPGAPQYGLHRVAVGEHLLLGGDNLDLALAQRVEGLFREFGKDRLRGSEWESLRQQSRIAKEVMLGPDPPAHFRFSIINSGSRLFEGRRSIEVEREIIEATLLEGFFPLVDIREHPQETASGLLEFGLPYTDDPAITRHLARFLWEHRWDGRSDEERTGLTDLLAARPDWILFNGGVLESAKIRRRLLEQLERWFQDASPSRLSGGDEPSRWQPGVLEADRLDLAVALGAAYFGQVRRGEGVRIDARLARAYYLQVSIEPPQAICVMPGDAKPFDRHRFDEYPFELEIGQPVQFPIFVSSTHLVHRPGELVTIDRDQMSPLPPIQTVLEAPRHRRAERLPVVLEAELTEIGTLDLSLIRRDSISTSDGQALPDATTGQTPRWRLAFDLRSTIETDRQAHQGQLEQSGIVDAATIDRGREWIHRAFAAEAPAELAKDLPKVLAETLGLPRGAWKPSLLRGLWQALMECEPSSKKQPQLESRWLNLLGYTLRPGYGYAADDWRVAATWRKVHGKIQHPSNASAALVLWRRIAGGFSSGQQQALYQEIIGRLRSYYESNAPANASHQDRVETIRLAGSLELLSLREKHDLAALAWRGLARPKLAAVHDASLWMLGRIGARELIYGPANVVLETEVVEEWLERLCGEAKGSPAHALAVMQWGRKTGDRFRDVSEAHRRLALAALERWDAPASYRQWVNEIAKLDEAAGATIIGESLPLGIQLRR